MCVTVTYMVSVILVGQPAFRRTESLLEHTQRSDVTLRDPCHLLPEMTSRRYLVDLT